MRLALLKLRNLGWLAVCLMVAVSLYPLSLSVASIRNKLTDTEAQIVRAKQRIRYLEVEFASRANMQQLQMWNDLDFGYSAPSPEQYLNGERELAMLGESVDSPKKPVQLAAAGGFDGVKPAGIVGPVESDRPVPGGAPSDVPLKLTKLEPAKVDSKIAPRPASAAPNPVQDEVKRRAAFAASMEANLLSDSPKNETRKEIAQ